MPQKGNLCYGRAMILFQIIGVAIFWLAWWFVSAFIGDQVAEDSSSNKRASTRFANVLATLPLVAFLGFRLIVESSLIYGPTDAALVFVPYLFTLLLISQR